MSADSNSPAASETPVAGTAPGFACGICGSPDGRRVMATERMFGMGGSFEYFECAKCGCLQITAVPADIGRYYPADKYYSYLPDAESMPAAHPSWLRRRFRPLRTQTFVFDRPLILAPLRRFGPPGNLPRLTSLFRGVRPSVRARVLDVGCGRGEHLKGLSDLGFGNLVGVDPFLPSTDSPAAGVTLHRCELGDLPVGGFDLIMMNHSLEHVPDQRATLAAAARRLAPGGVLRIEIPVADSTAWRTFGPDWVELDPPRHLYLHTSRSLAIVARDAGLAVWETEPLATPFEFWGSELYRAGETLHDPATNRVRWLEDGFGAEQAAHYNSLADRANADGTPGRRMFRLVARSDPRALAKAGGSQCP